ncbi:MAG: polysaccharide biosynthesis C-terminal domain-containing protein [Acidobacteriota bacterium]|jgi:O-antigen/teichoic acid export membrane protein
MSRVTPESSGPARAAAEADDATRGSAIKLGAEVLSRLLTLATTILIARNLGASGTGAFGTPWIIAPLVAELAEFGLQATATRALVAGTFSLGALVRARAVVFALVVLLVIVAAATPLASIVGTVAPPSFQLGVLAVLVLFFALSGWGEFLGVALRCRGARVQEGGVLLVVRASGLALAAAALAAGAGFGGLAWALAVSPLPGIALGAWLLRRHPPPVRGTDALVGPVLAAAFPLALYGGLLLLSPRVEFLVLAWTRGDYEKGLFFAVLNVVWPLSLVPSAVAAGAMPALTREALAGGGGVRQRTAGTLALFAAPASVGLMIVAPSLVPFVFGPEFAPGAVWLRIMALAVVPMFMNGLMTWALIAAERAASLPRLLATRIVVAFVLALLLVPRLGATGAAIGFVLAEAVLLVLSVRACAAARFAVPVGRAIVVALLATLPMALAVWGVRDTLVLALGVGGLTYAATLAAAWQLFPGLARPLLGAGATGSADAGPR